MVISIVNQWFSIKYGDLPMKNADFPMKNGDFPIEHGDFPASFVCF